jgi:hypothetical protein
MKHLSIEQAIERGYVVHEHHIHEKNKNYSVTMAKGDEKKTFANISKEHLDSIIAAQSVSKEKHLPLDKAIEHGFTVHDYHMHEKDKNYSVTMVKDDEKKTFSNVTKEHLDSILVPHVKMQGSQTVKIQ